MSPMRFLLKIEIEGIIQYPKNKLGFSVHLRPRVPDYPSQAMRVLT